MTEDTKSKPRTFKVQNFIDADQLSKDISFSPVDLTSAMVEQSALVVHYGTLLAKSQRQTEDLKLVLENAEARVYRQLRDKAAETGTKMTEAQLEKEVILSETVLALKKALSEARQIEATAKIAVDAFRGRRDMLTSMGLMAREELRGEMSINRRNEVEQALDATKERYMRRMAGAA